MSVKAVKYLKAIDPVLGNVISIIPPPQFESTGEVFHDLMSCTIEQQIHYRSTKKIFERMLEKANLRVLTPNNFPKFEESALADVKLSTRKYETIINILRHWNENNLNYCSLTDQEVRDDLSQIKGVGKWTVDMILLFTLERPDVFSLDDFHIKQVMTSIYHLDAKSKLRTQMKEVATAWSPYQSTAFLYLLDWKKFNQKNPQQ